MATVLNARLNQVIPVDGESRSAFFNGRLLSAEDLTREQEARDGAERRLARLIGCGVAEGLSVAAGAGSVLHISAGLGVTPSGAVIDIGNLDLDLSSAGRGSSFSGFGNCAAGLAEGQPLAGIYLLTLTPAWSGQGRAATLLGEVGACNRRTQQSAVRARLVEVQASAVTAAAVRNELAVALLSPGQGLIQVPEGGRVGWWMRQRIAGGAAAPGLTADELPLALLQIDANATPQWVDTDSARRHLAPPPGEAGDAMWPSSWAVEMRAFAAQFLAELMVAGKKPEAFTWLPPTLPMNTAQLARLHTLMPNRLPATPKVLERPLFARALLDGWQDIPVRRDSAQLHLAQLEGHPERLLLRATGNFDGGDVKIVNGVGERTSPKVASAAARILRAGKNSRFSKEELSVAASALTQAPNRKKR